MATITDDKLRMFMLVDRAFPLLKPEDEDYSARDNLDNRSNRAKLKITIARM